MAKSKFIAVILAALAAPLAGVAAHAQNDNGLVAPELGQPTPGHLLRQDYITGTGATVDRPGVSQSAGPTPLDRAIERENDKIDNSICTGC